MTKGHALFQARSHLGKRAFVRYRHLPDPYRERVHVEIGVWCRWLGLIPYRRVIVRHFYVEGEGPFPPDEGEAWTLAVEELLRQ